MKNRTFLIFATGASVMTLAMTACAPTTFASKSASTALAADPSSSSTTPVVPALPAQPGGSIVTQKVSESFNQNQYAGQVDILFVVDNSFSMQSLQSKVASRFGSLTSSLANIDYHIGLTTTDLDSKNYDIDGQLQTWTGLGSKTLTQLASNPDSIFSQSLVRPETLACTTLTYDCPSGNEQPLKATIRAIQQKDTTNAGFFRDGAPLAVIVLSNEDELSDGVTPTTAQDTGASLMPTSTTAVLSAVTSVFGASKKFMYNGIVTKIGDTTCLAQQRALSVNNGAYFGSHVTQLAQLTNGSTYSICDNDYSQSLQDISNRVRDLVGSFALKAIPLVSSVHVTLTPAPPVATYRIVGQQIIFDVAPPVGTKIDVEYLPL